MKRTLSRLNGLMNRRTLFIAAFAAHLVVAFAIYWGFQPVRGGDEDFYHSQAVEIASRIHAGNFTLAGIDLNSWYTPILGAWYAFGFPHPLWGGVLSALLAGLTALLLFAISRELGAGHRQAFWVGIAGAILYPSYLYLGSFTLRDTMIVPLVLSGFLLTLKFLRNPSPLFFRRPTSSGLAIRRPTGASLILALIFLNTVALFGVKSQIGMIFALALFTAALFLKGSARLGLAGAGLASFILIPIFFGWGVTGPGWLRGALDPETIAYRREAVYSYSPPLSTYFGVRPESAVIGIRFNPDQLLSVENISGYAYSFAAVALGPFPWQMREPAHWLALAETIPWYFVLYFAIRGIIRDFRGARKTAVLVVFALILISSIALISDNFGANARFRMPAFLALLTIAPLGFKRQAQ